MTEARLVQFLKGYDKVAIAISGGVDSMTLSFIAHQALGSAATMVHAISPAVPSAATERVREFAELYDWQLRVLDADEFSDERYLQNPSNRCFFCKSNLYQTLSNLSDGVVMSGTNTDDLSDWRPGLKAAETYNVIHPFVEVGVDKNSIRELARNFGLDELAELPASPCLSSRVETGIRIQPSTLKFVEQVEKFVTEKYAPQTVRCRVRDREVMIALDDKTLNCLSESDIMQMSRTVSQMALAPSDKPVHVGQYRRGDAFLR